MGDAAAEIIQTRLKINDDRAEFIVRTANTLYQNRLVKMGWQAAGIDTFSRKVSMNDDVVRIFENFTEHIVEMIEQSARLRPVPWEIALEEFVDRTHQSGLQWWLYGSGALAVRGIDIEPGDLDLAVSDSWLVGELLRDLLVEPVTRMENWVAQSGGRAFHGALIEWMSDAEATGAVPPHEQEPATAAYLESVSWRGRLVPVPSLDLHLRVAERRGLHDRCALIRDAMSH